MAINNRPSLRYHRSVSTVRASRRVRAEPDTSVLPRGSFLSLCTRAFVLSFCNSSLSALSKAVGTCHPGDQKQILVDTRSLACN